jgi:flagellar protein FliL
VVNGSGEAHFFMVGSANGEGLSLRGWVGTVLMCTLVAAGVGGGLGIALVGRMKAGEQKQVAAPVVSGPAPKYGMDTSLIDLPPVITNLADPPTAWVRLQASIVYDNKAVPKPELLAAKVAEDVLAYMKTVTVAQIGGASGLEHLREDLNERASIRSDGHIRELIIQTVVVQ